MSTYLIDCSKKCYLGGPSSLMGDISESSLQGLGLCFKENFMAANDQLKKDFDKLTKPVKTMLQGVLSAIPILKGIDIQNGDLRETLINGYVLLSTFMGSKDIDIDLDNWNKIYLRNYPLRKGPPVIGLKSGGITIEFAYGKANMFDAYYEVFQPLSQLQRSLFPSFTSTGSLNTTGIKYVQQSFPAVITAFGSGGLTTLKTQAGNLNKVTKAIKQTFNNKKVKVAVKAAIKKAASSTKYSDWKNSKSNFLDGIFTAKAYNSEGKMVVDNLEALSSLGSTLKGYDENELFSKDETSIIINIPGQDGGGKDDSGNVGSNPSEETKPDDNAKMNTTKVLEIVEEGLDEIIDSVYEDGFSATFDSVKGTLSIKEVDNAAGTTSTSLKDVFTSVVNLEYNTIKTAMESLAPTAGVRSIHLGFPSIYCTSQAQVEKNCNPVDARVHYWSVIVQGANITFDYSKVDEAGYPMAGKLVIEQLWNVNTPQSTLGFSTGDGSKYVKNTLTLVDSTEFDDEGLKSKVKEAFKEATK